MFGQCGNGEFTSILPLGALLLEITVVRVDELLLILPLVWTMRVLTMNKTLRAIILPILVMGLPAEAWSQMPGPSPAAPPIPSSVPSIGFGSLGTLYPSGQIPSSLPSNAMQPVPSMQPMPTCGACGAPPMGCGCDDGFTYASPCSGACGGSCAGGCGSKSGVLGRLLGGGLGAGLGAGIGTSGGWLDVEYLLWWNKDRFVPALATQSPAGTPAATAGQLGQPSTSILFGNDLINGGPHSGFRVSTGKWLDQQQSNGIGFRYFFVAGEEDLNARSSGDPILARPFFNTSTNAQDALLVAFPGDSSGSIDVTARNEAGGFDIFVRKLLLSGHCNRFDLIGGYHNSYIEDSVEINSSLTALNGNRVPIDTVISTRDYFEVNNQFHGGFVGLMAESADGPLSWSTMAKVAFGNMNQEARIRGEATTSIPGAGSAGTPAGLLALPTNIGTFDQDEFAIVPELNVSVRYNVSDRFQVLLGYSFIYWSEVALSGDMIDLNVNTTQIDGALVGNASPARQPLQSDGFWYSGLSIGGALRF